jgi:RNA polymerase sigma factor (TIGR02999 family)
MASNPDITQLLVRWKNGNQAALDELFPLVYRELRSLARSHLRRERRGHTLQATALVHEMFVRLATGGRVDWQDRSHFFGVAARAMRQILVTHARQHGAQKRGGGVETVDAAGVAAPIADRGIDLETLDAALTDLEALDPRLGKVVELRFFGGFTIDETAELLHCSAATVSRDWQIARLWLRRRMAGDAA